MFIQMRVANKSENNCGVCQLSTPKHHLTAPQTKILCTRGNGHTIFAEKKKKKRSLSRVEPKEELIGASQSKRKTKRRQMLLFREAGSCRTSSVLKPATFDVACVPLHHIPPTGEISVNSSHTLTRTHKDRMGGSESERKEEGAQRALKRVIENIQRGMGVRERDKHAGLEEGQRP